MTTVLVCLLLASAVLMWPGRAHPGGPDRPSRLWRGRSSPADRLLARLVAGRRSGASVEEVADALVLVALALRAGLPLADALQHVQADAGPGVRTELGSVVAALRWGRPAYEAWGFAGDGWRVAALATHMSEQTGAAPAGLITAAAVRLRGEQERERERAAARAGVLLVLPLGLGFLPAFACTAVVPVVLNLASAVLAGGV